MSSDDAAALGGDQAQGLGFRVHGREGTDVFAVIVDCAGIVADQSLRFRV